MAGRFTRLVVVDNIEKNLIPSYEYKCFVSTNNYEITKDKQIIIGNIAFEDNFGSVNLIKKTNGPCLYQIGLKLKLNRSKKS